jgi:hypothetical protein
MTTLPTGGISNFFQRVFAWLRGTANLAGVLRPSFDGATYNYILMLLTTVLIVGLANRVGLGAGRAATHNRSGEDPQNRSNQKRKCRFADHGVLSFCGGPSTLVTDRLAVNHKDLT